MRLGVRSLDISHKSTVRGWELEYRGTSLISKRTPLGSYRRPMPRVVGGSYGVGRFPIGEVPLYSGRLFCGRGRPRGQKKRGIYGQQPNGPNLLHHQDDLSRPALLHGSLNSLFQVALYLPSYSLSISLSRALGVQAYLAHKKTPTLLGPPWDPRHRPTVGS